MFALLIRAPGLVEPRQIAEACHQTREWAEERSMLEAAMLFAEAAALTEPEDPGYANTAGRLCRRAAYDERSTTWYHRAFGLAVRMRERTETIRALLGYGGLMYHLGRHSDARRYYERAVRVAVHTGRHRQAAEAKHDMVLIAAEAETYHEGERHARQALQYYPVHHPRISYLVHDVAFLFVRNRLYSSALPLLRSVRRHSPCQENKLWCGAASREQRVGQVRSPFFGKQQKKCSRWLHRSANMQLQRCGTWPKAPGPAVIGREPNSWPKEQSKSRVPAKRVNQSAEHRLCW